MDKVKEKSTRLSPSPTTVPRHEPRQMWLLTLPEGAGGSFQCVRPWRVPVAPECARPRGSRRAPQCAGAPGCAHTSPPVLLQRVPGPAHPGDPQRLTKGPGVRCRPAVWGGCGGRGGCGRAGAGGSAGRGAEAAPRGALSSMGPEVAGARATLGTARQLPPTLASPAPAPTHPRALPGFWGRRRETQGVGRSGRNRALRLPQRGTRERVGDPRGLWERAVVPGHSRREVPGGGRGPRGGPAARCSPVPVHGAWSPARCTWGVMGTPNKDGGRGCGWPAGPHPTPLLAGVLAADLTPEAGGGGGAVGPGASGRLRGSVAGTGLVCWARERPGMDGGCMGEGCGDRREDGQRDGQGTDGGPRGDGREDRREDR